MAKWQTKKNRYTEKALIVVPLLIIVYIVFDYSVLGLINLQRERPLRFFPVNTFVEYNMGLDPQFFTNREGIFLSTREGIFVYDSDGNLSWELEYVMDRPIFIGEGNFVGLAELMGNTMHIINRRGLAYTKTFDDPILTFTINSEGFSAVILERGSGYAVYVHDEIGNMLMDIEFQETNIFPTSIAVSNNGRILAIAFLDINDINISSNVLFAYINQNESSNYVDGIFGASARQDNQIIGNLQFMDSNQLAVVSSDRITVINTNRERLLNVEWYIEFTENVSHVVFPSSGVLAIVYESGTIKFYNSSGRLMGVHEISGGINYISDALGNVIVGTGSLNRRFYAINSRGAILWEHMALQDVNQLLFLDQINRVLFASSINAQILERRQQPIE